MKKLKPIKGNIACLTEMNFADTKTKESKKEKDKKANTRKIKETIR